MLLPLDVRFRNFHSSAAVEAAVRERAAKLDRFHPRITSCRVMVEALHQRRVKGSVYHVRVDITVPGREIVAESEPPSSDPHDDVYIAIRDAFDGAKRELQDDIRKRRREVKLHEERPSARVTKIFHDRGFGFLETDEGVEVYFHQHSVLDGAFEDLAVGSRVFYEEEAGEKGPQASSVEPAETGKAPTAH